MEDQYGMADLRHYITSRPLFSQIPPPPDLLSTHRGLNAPHPYDMLIFRSDSPATANTSAAGGGGGGGGVGAAASSSGGHCFGGFDSGLNGGGEGGAGRWPRQETLTLLEIRSRLDPKFKEANQKGPLWDEVSRIMSEEHGYQRSGKKCREKFENLYKYYKKTKEGKAGRQDGKHYRFFRQLEALYGESTNNNSSASMSESHLPAAAAAAATGNNNNNYHSHYSNKIAVQDTSLSLSNYSDADTTSSEEDDTADLNEGLGMNDHEGKMKKRSGSGWKVKIRDFIDAQMKKLMDKQEAWMEKMMSAIEEKERERMMREEEWRKQDTVRIEREHKFWASERAWIEARDAALMDALHKMTGNKEMITDDGSETMTTKGGDIWPECEINRLVQLTTAAMEGKFEQRGMVWEEIATKMGCFGHERSAVMCKEKWDSINNYLLKCSKKRKDNSKSCNYFQSHGGGGGIYCDNSEQENGDNHHHQQDMSLNHDHGGSAAISESCFRYFMGDGYGRIIG